MSEGSGRFRLPTEIPLEVYPKPEEFVNEAKSIVEEAEENNIILRVMGGLAIYILIQGSKYEDTWRNLARLGERVFTDIDLASYGKYRKAVLEFFTKKRKKCRYEVFQQSLYYYRGTRYIFYGCPEGCMIRGYQGCRIPMVEVFFDKLEMNHIIPFKNRLEICKYTLSPTDILLTKLQIVKINEKDIKDAITLLLAYDIGSTDDNMINGKYIAKLMSQDWGFYYTFTTNLKKVKEFSGKYSDKLSESEISIVSSRVDKLLDMIEKEPKSLGWKMRARVGTKKKWYNEVDEWY